MALNRRGEVIGDLGNDFNLAPLARWTDTPLYEEAYTKARDSFAAAGALHPVQIDPNQVLVQEYPHTNKVCFLFFRQIAGRDHYYPYVFSLPEKLVAELRTTGRWGKTH